MYPILFFYSKTAYRDYLKKETIIKIKKDKLKLKCLKNRLILKCKRKQKISLHIIYIIFYKRFTF